MKVADIMQRNVEYVSANTSVREISDLIFGRSINAVPVVNEGKIVGIISERDILAALYPTMSELVDDPVHSQDFSEIEERANEVLKLPAKKIMSRTITTIREDDHILKAQAKMLANKIGRLPVLNKDKKLVGVISKGDIFRAAIGAKIPNGKEENFYDWLSHHYDILIDWPKRLKVEISDLDKIFKKNKINKVLDVGSSTGEHAIALTKKGYNVTGVDASKFIGKVAELKKGKLSQAQQEKLQFFYGKYKNTINNLNDSFNAVLFLGNGLSHILNSNKDVLKEVTKILIPKQSVIIIQLVNYNKIFKKSNGFDGYLKSSAPSGILRDHVFFSFYTKDKGNKATLYQSIYDSDGKKWVYSGMRNTTVVVLYEKDIRKMLTKLGYKNIKVYGSSYYEKMFDKPFDAVESDLMSVIAEF